MGAARWRRRLPRCCPPAGSAALNFPFAELNYRRVVPVVMGDMSGRVAAAGRVGMSVGRRRSVSLAGPTRYLAKRCMTRVLCLRRRRVVDPAGRGLPAVRNCVFAGRLAAVTTSSSCRYDTSAVGCSGRAGCGNRRGRTAGARRGQCWFPFARPDESGGSAVWVARQLQDFRRNRVSWAAGLPRWGGVVAQSAGQRGWGQPVLSLDGAGELFAESRNS